MSKDLRFRKTRDAIHAAFLKRVEDGTFENLTVKELAAEANINRKTFYLHYASLQDLIAELQDVIVKEAIRRIADCKIPKDLEEVICTLFEYWSSLPEEQNRIYVYSANNSIGKSFSEQMKERGPRYSQDFAISNPTEEKFLFSFIVDSIATIYTEWLNHPEVSLGHAVRVTHKLILHGIEAC